jgi:hypothetical protein
MASNIGQSIRVWSSSQAGHFPFMFFFLFVGSTEDGSPTTLDLGTFLGLASLDLARQTIARILLEARQNRNDVQNSYGKNLTWGQFYKSASAQFAQIKLLCMTLFGFKCKIHYLLLSTIPR